MDTIDRSAMVDAANYVGECAQHAVIHTVTVTLNGAHGGADVIIEGTVFDGDDISSLITGSYTRTYQIS